MDDQQRAKLTALYSSQKVATLVTSGEAWPTVTLQAFAETADLDILFIMNDSSEKYRSLTKWPNTTLMIDDRDVPGADIATFKVSRVSIRGVAREVPRDSAEWDRCKTIFLAKAPFEAPFFGHSALRMMCVRPVSIAYAGADRTGFKLDL
jgi:hypothetical protein